MFLHFSIYSHESFYSVKIQNLLLLHSFLLLYQLESWRTELLPDDNAISASPDAFLWAESTLASNKHLDKNTGNTNNKHSLVSSFFLGKKRIHKHTSAALESCDRNLFVKWTFAPRNHDNLLSADCTQTLSGLPTTWSMRRLWGIIVLRFIFSCLLVLAPLNTRGNKKKQHKLKTNYMECPDIRWFQTPKKD